MFDLRFGDLTVGDGAAAKVHFIYFICFMPILFSHMYCVSFNYLSIAEMFFLISNGIFRNVLIFKNGK